MLDAFTDEIGPLVAPYDRDARASALLPNEGAVGAVLLMTHLSAAGDCYVSCLPALRTLPHHVGGSLCVGTCANLRAKQPSLRVGGSLDVLLCGAQSDLPHDTRVCGLVSLRHLRALLELRAVLARVRGALIVRQCGSL